MNKLSFLLAGLAGAAVFSASAGELYSPQPYEEATHGLTRAQVKQSVLQARRAGELDHNDIDLPGNGTLMTGNREFGRTRASVKGEVSAARADGELNHNDVDLPTVAKTSVLDRSTVRAEATAGARAVKPARTAEF